MLLKIKNVTSGYGKNVILEGINLKIDEGEINALVGPNGAGKTTTLRTIVGQLKPSKGTVTYNDEDLANMNTYKIVEKGIAYCPEGRDVFGNLTVYENLKMGAYLVKSKKEFEQQIEWLYSLFPRLEERRKQLSASLSGGEQQMLAIARALMSSPKLLLLDEPSLGIAPVLVDKIFKQIEEINKSGVAILLVEQNVNLALSISHRGYVIESGKIHLDDTSDNLLSNEHVKNAYLGVV